MHTKPLTACHDSVAEATRRVAAGENIDARPVHDCVRALFDILSHHPECTRNLSREALVALVEDLERLEQALHAQHRAAGGQVDPQR